MKILIVDGAPSSHSAIAEMVTKRAATSHGALSGFQIASAGKLGLVCKNTKHFAC